MKRNVKTRQRELWSRFFNIGLTFSEFSVKRQICAHWVSAALPHNPGDHDIFQQHYMF